MATTTSTARPAAARTPLWYLRRWGGEALVYAALALGTLVTALPFAYMVTGSTKLDAELFRVPLTLAPERPTFLSYERLISGEQIPFVRQFLNSAFVAVSQTVLTLLVASLVGWGFARYEFRGKRALFAFVLITLTFPAQVTLVPQFLLMLRLGWLDTYWAIIIPGAISAFGVFFMRQNMLAVPEDLLDAGRIDGVSELGLYWRIGLPLARGALSVLAVLTFLASWNDYLWPLIVLRSAENFTYPVGLATLYGLYKIEYSMILAGATIVTLPVIALFVAGRNQLLDSLTVGAVKG